jgi:DNA polymerase
VIGKQHQLLKLRGTFIASPHANFVTATVHPSAILRAPDAERRNAEYDAFVKDLARVGEAINHGAGAGHRAAG